MKFSNSNRHKQRIDVVKELFSLDFSKEQLTSQKLTQEVQKQKGRVDEFILAAAPAWPIEKINKIDLAILRLAVYELLIEKETPPKVIVDEAVEIAKEYGSESSASFINGVLGKLILDHKIAT